MQNKYNQIETIYFRIFVKIIFNSIKIFNIKDNAFFIIQINFSFTLIIMLP